MSQILVRNLDPETVSRLKAQAKRNGRSLQNEVKFILEEAAARASGDVKTIIERWRNRFEGRRFDDSADLIREDRER